MDLIDVLKPFFDFLSRFLSVSISLGGFSFTIGALWLWVIVGGAIIVFLKRLGG